MASNPSEGRLAYDAVAEELSGARTPAERKLILQCLGEQTLLQAHDYAKRSKKKWPPRPQTSGWTFTVISR